MVYSPGVWLGGVRVYSLCMGTLEVYVVYSWCVGLGGVRGVLLVYGTWRCTWFGMCWCLVFLIFVDVLVSFCASICLVYI